MVIVAAFLAGFAIPAAWWVAALAFAKFVLQRDLPVSEVAPHGSRNTLGNAGAGQGNTPATFIEVR